MTDSVKDRGILSLSWPLIVTFGIGVFQPMMDSWFLSRINESAAAGVGALMPILGTIFIAIQAFSQAEQASLRNFSGQTQTATRERRFRWSSSGVCSWASQ